MFGVLQLRLPGNDLLSRMKIPDHPSARRTGIPAAINPIEPLRVIGDYDSRGPECRVDVWILPVLRCPKHVAGSDRGAADRLAPHVAALPAEGLAGVSELRVIGHRSGVGKGEFSAPCRQPQHRSLCHRVYDRPGYLGRGEVDDSLLGKCHQAAFRGRVEHLDEVGLGKVPAACGVTIQIEKLDPVRGQEIAGDLVRADELIARYPRSRRHRTGSAAGHVGDGVQQNDPFAGERPLNTFDTSGLVCRQARIDVQLMEMAGGCASRAPPPTAHGPSGPRARQLYRRRARIR